eukprot:TRINITY_DN10660_c0_g1_i1.p1 TRINITY_DN10660_c0_g1~~TRINITY_DN10660_c0_g1_i1.p1  ORF type:complete len:286 (+),score=35.38 TRINITY_DN10660_c0_g1_i1:2-859(+)
MRINNILATIALLCLVFFVPLVASSMADPVLARELFDLAQASYCDVSPTQWNCPTCNTNSSSDFIVTKISFDKKTSTFGFVGFSPYFNAIVISFRGTVASKLKNWAANLDGIPMDFDLEHCQDCKVHSGFYHAWSGHNNTIINEVERITMKYPDVKLYATGHSLGGSIAALAASTLDHLGFNVNVLTTYGCPRVGNEFFADHMISITSSTRVVNSADIIPHLAPKFTGFHHFAQEVWIRREKREFVEHICDMSGEDPTCSDSLAVPLNILDHLKYYGVTTGSYGC